MTAVAHLGEHVHTPSETPPVEDRQNPCTLGICGRRADVHSVAVDRDAPSDASLAAAGWSSTVAATAAAIDLVAGLEVTQQLPVLLVLCALTIPHLRMSCI
jgi:hypothetical protein